MRIKKDFNTARGCINTGWVALHLSADIYGVICTKTIYLQDKERPLKNVLFNVRVAVCA